MAGETQSGPLSTEDVLRDEAKAIHGDKLDALNIDPSTLSGTELYRTLNKLDSAALCLSGGGIRSASFALGVIQALAAHPRPLNKDGNVQANKPVGNENDTLLAKFDYLSTVSGGGYIGSWLSAGIARTSFADMWRKLVYREPRPEDEAPQISWLRTYSNFLTPRLGLTSADTWTAVALYVRNLLLNWLVVIPVLCVGLILVKLVAVESFWLAYASREIVVALFIIGAILEIWALRFALLHRPTRPNRIRGVSAESAAAVQDLAQQENRGVQQEDERRQAVGRGADQGRFLRFDLVPALTASFAFMLVFMPDYTDFLFRLAAWELIGAGIIFGFILYAIAWIIAVPWPKRDQGRGVRYWAKDLWFWAVSGGVCGAIVGFGVFLFTYDLSLLIGNIDVTTRTKDTLLLLIYAVPWIIMAQLGAEMIFVGLTSWQINSDADREWFGRSSGWFAVSALTWLVLTFLILVGADLAYSLWQVGSSFMTTTGSMISAIAGAVTAVLGKSSATPAQNGKAGSSWIKAILAISTGIFLIALVVGFSALLDDLLLDYSLLKSPLIGGQGASNGAASVPHALLQDLEWLFIGLAAAAFVGWQASAHVNVNRFSLHALYRNRLIRAFLGATNPGRNPDMFTGFDERDNPNMTLLWLEGRKFKKLFHVINMALNVVSSQRLAWQERKAESFTASPRHCGSAYKAFRPSNEYGGPNGISLGTAMAISGAAASPNMGYHSSPLVTFLLALFNVRLGWWLGNPGKEGNDTYPTEGPTTAIKPLLDEMFGRTTDQNSYVYLSDGGHFENLGLYEMVRRRCRFIVVSDAGCDKEFKFDDLGNAARKIWLDLGVPITFRGLNSLRYRAKRSATYEPYLPPFHAIGTIDYQAADGGESKQGMILYLKPCFHRNRIGNIGVRNYAVTHPDFPHESTADQFFSESQFESYRALGFEMTDAVFSQALENAKLPSQPTLEDIFNLLPQTVAAAP